MKTKRICKEKKYRTSFSRENPTRIS